MTINCKTLSLSMFRSAIELCKVITYSSQNTLLHMIGEEILQSSAVSFSLCRSWAVLNTLCRSTHQSNKMSLSGANDKCIPPWSLKLSILSRMHQFDRHLMWPWELCQGRVQFFFLQKHNLLRRINNASAGNRDKNNMEKGKKLQSGRFSSLLLLWMCF